MASPASADVASGDAVHATVIAVSESSPVVALEAAAVGSAGLGDRVLMAASPGAWSAAGDVIFIHDRRIGVCLSPRSGRVEAGMSAWILPRSAPGPVAELMFGDWAYPITQIDSVLPGGGHIWVAAETADGWPEGTPILVRRGAAILAWGQVVKRSGKAALVALDREAMGPPVRRGDTVEVLGAPGHIWRTRVAEVATDGLLLAGGSDLGVAEGDRFDLLRDGQYVGLAVVSQTHPVLRAEIESAFTRDSPKIGDDARLRGAHADHARQGWVFRIEGDYGLVSLGEADGVVRGQRLRAGKLLLEVRAVYPFHCGVQVIASPDKTAGGLSMWAQVSTMTSANADGAGSGAGSDADVENTASLAEADEPRLVTIRRAEPSELAPWLYRVTSDRPLTRGAWVLLDGAIGLVIEVGVIDDGSVEDGAGSAFVGWAVRLDGWRF